MSIIGDTSWSGNPRWNAAVWIIAFLSLFGGCVVCNRNPDVPLIQINRCEAESEPPK